MIRLEDPAGAESASGTIITTDPAGAHPKTWDDFTVSPWLPVFEPQCGFTVTLTPAGLQLANTNPLAASATMWATCGLTPNGYFMPDLGGFLILTMHVTGFTGPTDTVNGEFNSFCIALASRLGGCDETTNAGQMMLEFGSKSSTAGHLGEQDFIQSRIVVAATARTKAENISDALVADEFELELRMRPANLGAPQSATITRTVIDYVICKRWIAGVPQVNLEMINTALGAAINRIAFYAWAGFHVFFGHQSGKASKTVAGTITEIRMDRGRFVPYV